MNKIYFIAFFLAWSLFSIAQKPNHYFCNYTNQPIQIDGIQEKVWQNATLSSPFVDISIPAAETPKYSTHFKMLWDSTYLYLFAQLEEPHIKSFLTNHDDTIYRDNDFELFIDANGNGSNYYEIEINSNSAILDLFMEKPYNKGGSADLSWNTPGLIKAVRVCGTLNNANDIDSCWNVEMAIPWNALKQTAPTINTIWRMNFSRVQWDYNIVNGAYIKKKDESGVDLKEHNWVWSPQGKINMHIPEKWGFIHFVKKQTPVFSGVDGSQQFVEC